MANKPPRPIATPCVNVCVIDGASGLCLGCYRSLAEVAGWSRLSPGARRAIMEGLAGRRGRIAAEKLQLI